MEPATILYDGHCGICCAIHARYHHRSRPGLLRWATIESDEGMAILEPRGLVETAADSMVLQVGDRIYLRSAAAVQVLKRLKAPHNAMAPLLWLVPKPLREWGYKQVAARRSRSCALPGPGSPPAPPAS